MSKQGESSTDNNNNNGRRSSSSAEGDTANGNNNGGRKTVDLKRTMGGAGAGADAGYFSSTTTALVVAGVAAYVVVVYVFWETFRVYFDWTESLAITIKEGLPRISVLDLFGSILTCQAYRSIAHFPKHAVETLVACTIMQFGGTLLVGVLVLGQTASWMTSFTAWPALVVAWWLTFFSPFDLWHGGAMRYRAVVFISAFGRAVSAAHAITSWGVDKALTAHYEKATTSAVCAILCGTVAGCGGGILAELLSLEGDKWNVRQTPTALASPSFSVQRCFGASCLYYVLADPHGYLSADTPAPLSWLGSWSVAHGDGASTEAAAMVAVYVTANHLMDYFIPNYEDPLCKALKVFLHLIGVRAIVDPKPVIDHEEAAKEKEKTG